MGVNIKSDSERSRRGLQESILSSRLGLTFSKREGRITFATFPCVTRGKGDLGEGLEGEQGRWKGLASVRSSYRM